MISIIICSTKPNIPISLRENIEKTVGVNYELVVIDNSSNKYSIFSAYNRGVERSLYPYLCFIHEDVLFKTTGWGEKIINHLSDKKTGIVGIAGGKIATKIPASWSTGGRILYITQHQHRKKKSLLLKEPHSFTGVRLPAVILDGVFLSMRKELFETIKFDENIDGFHGYDYDISIQSKVAGYINYVIYDTLLEHFSEGNTTKQYYINLIKIFRKWENHLPLFADDISDIQKNAGKIEKKNLAKLIRRLARVGFDKKEIKYQAHYYATILDDKGASQCLRFLNLKILFERVFNS